MRLHSVRKVFFGLMAAMVALTPMLAKAELSTSAGQAVIMDANSKDVLFAHNAREQMVPSSMTKIMTLYMLFERLKAGVIKMDDTFQVSEKAWRMGGSKMFVRVNTRVLVKDLIQGIVVQSGNDACIVVAEAIAGSEEAFAERMNEKAKELGMKNTHFVNSTGWPDENHYSTAYDLALLSAKMIEEFPEYYEFFKEKSFTYNNIRQSNRNLLLWRPDTGADGLKTGHTEAGGYGVVVSGKEGGRRMVVVVNGLESAKARADEAERLLSHGFRYFETETLVNAGEVVGTAPVWQGEAQEVPLSVKQAVEVVLPKIDKDKTKISLHYNSPLIAPVEAGVEVGELHVRASGQEEAKIFPVYTAESVSRDGVFGRIISSLMN